MGGRATPTRVVRAHPTRGAKQSRASRYLTPAGCLRTVANLARVYLMELMNQLVIARDAASWAGAATGEVEGALTILPGVQNGLLLGVVRILVLEDIVIVVLDSRLLPRRFRSG